MADHRLPALDNSNRTLVELMPDVAFLAMEAAVAPLERGGHIPALA